MNLFNQYDNVGKDAVKSWLDEYCGLYSIDYNLPQYSTFDGIITNNKTNQQSIIEIKSRNVPIDKYDNCFVNYEKINQLQNISKKNGIRTFLIAVYPQNKTICQWEINPNTIYPIEQITSNKQTANPDIGKWSHWVVPFYIDKAKKYLYN